MRIPALLLAGLMGLAQQAVPQVIAQCDSCAKPKPVYKVSRMSLTEVGITCLNGADPTGQKFGNVLVISCGKE